MARSDSILKTSPRHRPAKKRNYITRSGGQWHPGDVALAMALVIRQEDSAEGLRKLARRLVDKVCMEQQPSLKLLMRAKDDAAVWRACMRIINRVCEMWNIQPDKPFLRNLIPPRCHMKPMVLVAKTSWVCQHCSHTKPFKELIQ